MERQRVYDARSRTFFRIGGRLIAAALALSMAGAMRGDAQQTVTGFMTAKTPVAFACFDPESVTITQNGHSTTVYAPDRRGVVLAGPVEGQVSFTTSPQGECALFLGDNASKVSQSDVQQAIQDLGLPSTVPVDLLS